MGFLSAGRLAQTSTTVLPESDRTHVSTRENGSSHGRTHQVQVPAALRSLKCCPRIHCSSLAAKTDFPDPAWPEIKSTPLFWSLKKPETLSMSKILESWQCGRM